MRSNLRRTRRIDQSCDLLLVVIILSGWVLQVGAQEEDRRIAEIRRLSTQVSEQIAESERNAEGSGVYCNELVVNKGDKSWPAVGIYKTVFSFYYTFGDREKDPYPNRLLKVTVTTNRSNRHEYAEFLFNPAGQLIFYFDKSEDGSQDRRYYFASNRLIRQMRGERVVAMNAREALRVAKRVFSEEKKLKQIFQLSLGSLIS